MYFGGIFVDGTVEMDVKMDVEWSYPSSNTGRFENHHLRRMVSRGVVEWLGIGEDELEGWE